MDLLSAAERLEIFAAIHDVTDTFCQLPIAYELRGDSLDWANEDRNDEEVTIYNLMGLIVYSDKKIDLKQYGVQDLGDGYVLFNWEDLQAAGLINGDNFPIMDPARDYMTAQGVRLRALAVPPLGQLGIRQAVVKVFFMKEPKTR